MKVFLDTNVVVDFCMRREPFFHDAAVIFDLAYQRRISVVISSLTFVNLVYLGRKVMDSDALLRKVQWLMNLSEVSKIDRTVISQGYMPNVRILRMLCSFILRLRLMSI